MVRFFFNQLNSRNKIVEYNVMSCLYLLLAEIVLWHNRSHRWQKRITSISIYVYIVTICTSMYVALDKSVCQMTIM